jgi:hypothetical protein
MVGGPLGTLDAPPAVGLELVRTWHDRPMASLAAGAAYEVGDRWRQRAGARVQRQARELARLSSCSLTA